MMENIILTGFMGTGKTTVGRLLAERLNYEFIDTDDVIEKRLGLSVADIFARLGEETFRQMETAVAKELSQRAGLVISTGGRMMLDPANVSALSRSGRIFCLTAAPEEILARLTQDTDHPRPLLKVSNPGERIVELFRQREAGYRQFPQVETSGKQPEEVAMELLSLIKIDSKQNPSR